MSEKISKGISFRSSSRTSFRMKVSASVGKRLMMYASFVDSRPIIHLSLSLIAVEPAYRSPHYVAKEHRHRVLTLKGFLPKPTLITTRLGGQSKAQAFERGLGRTNVIPRQRKDGGYQQSGAGAEETLAQSDRGGLRGKPLEFDRSTFSRYPRKHQGLRPTLSTSGDAKKLTKLPWAEIETTVPPWSNRWRDTLSRFTTA
jgi:hypothetical protein